MRRNFTNKKKAEMKQFVVKNFSIFYQKLLSNFPAFWLFVKLSNKFLFMSSAQLSWIIPAIYIFNDYWYKIQVQKQEQKKIYIFLNISQFFPLKNFLSPAEERILIGKFSTDSWKLLYAGGEWRQKG